jgi:hypothetical protein
MRADHHVRRMKWRRLGLAGFAVTILGLAFVHQLLVKPRELSTYFARLRPGMSYLEVMQFMPRAMCAGDKQSCTSVVWQTVLVRSNALPAYEVYCSGPLMPLPGIEAGRIYFDAQDRLVGANYGSSGAGGWKPRWGVRHE